jgi:hypothetical protein
VVGLGPGQAFFRAETAAVPPTLLGGLAAAGMVLAREELIGVLVDRDGRQRVPEGGTEVGEERYGHAEAASECSPEGRPRGNHAERELTDYREGFTQTKILFDRARFGNKRIWKPWRCQEKKPSPGDACTGVVEDDCSAIEYAVVRNSIDFGVREIGNVMLCTSATKLGIRPRDVIAVLTLVSHLFVTFGFPLPALSRKSKESSLPFPCQNKPCGCLTYDQCWKGDCCCFTLEEKLAWAEANGARPPDHVRPLVESRKSRPILPKKNSCCLEAEDAEEGKPTESAPCCSKAERLATPYCCDKPTGCCEQSAQDCPSCVANSSPICCQKKPGDDQSSVRWVVGIFAQKCRGEGPTGLFKVDPTVHPDLTSLSIPVREFVAFTLGFDCHVTSPSHSPPTPPPRRS